MVKTIDIFLTHVRARAQFNWQESFDIMRIWFSKKKTEREREENAN